MNKRMITKIAGGALGLLILAGTFLKDLIDQKNEEEYIKDTIDEKLNERFGSDQDEESEEDNEDEDE